MTRMGLGLAALGRPAYHNLGHADDVASRTSVQALMAHTHDMLDAAWAAGMRTFDVARSYGHGEAFLRSWLMNRAHPPSEISVGSKWGYTYVGNWRVEAAVHEVKDHSAETFKQQQGETLELLRPWLRTYSVHSATLDSGVLTNSIVLDALEAWHEQHGIRIGLTVSGPHQAEVIRKALTVRQGKLFQVVQATYNVLEPSVGDALAEAHAAGWGVVVKEGVANGRLTSRSDMPEALATLQTIASKLHTTPDAVALAAILAQPWADVVLSGATTIPQLNDNVGALKLKLSAAHLKALGALAIPAEDYWTSRAALPWT